MQVDDEQNTLSESDNLASVIGALALELHVNESLDLSCPLPAVLPAGKQSSVTNPDYEVDADTVRFASLGARNRIVAAHIFEERSRLPNAERDWLVAAYDLWRHEIRQDDSAAGRLLALVHENADIFMIATTAITSQSMKVFDVLLTVESALPYLKSLPPDGIWDLCEAQHELTKNDLAAGVLFGKLEKVLVAHPDVCRAVHERLKINATEATANLHPTVIVTLAKSSPEEAVELTLSDIDSQNPTLRGVALSTLAHLIILSVVTDSSIRQAEDALIAHTSNPNEVIRRTALRATANASRVTNAFVDVLTRLGTSQEPDALSAIAETLWRNRAETHAKPYFHDWIRLLCRTPPTAAATIEQFDHILSQLLDDESEQQFAVSCITEWVNTNGTDTPRNESFPKLFNLVTWELIKQRELLSQVVTDWLLSDGTRLPAAAAGLLSYLGVHGLENPEFNTSRLDTLDEIELLFLVRRLVGFIFSEGHSLSLAMSILKTRDAASRAHPILRSLLIDELGYDYPFAVIEALESVKPATKDKELEAFAVNTIQTIKDRTSALEGLPRLTELQPSTDLRRQLNRVRAKQMTKAMEGAREESVIRRLVTEVPIKGGAGYFSFRDGGYTEPGHLKSLSHSITLPRRLILDIVGHEISLFMLRNAKRGES